MQFKFEIQDFKFKISIGGIVVAKVQLKFEI